MRSPDGFAWDAFLAAARAKFPELYRAWFEELPAGQIESGELRITAADPAQARFLREHCTQALANVLMDQTGHLLGVRVVGPDGPGGTPAPAWAGLTPSPLSPDYTFDQFVVGPSNRLAHAACKAICSQPGSLYNPLFVHGASGLGKTHVLQAACADLARDSNLRVVYVSCESFINDFIRAIETGELARFRNQARRADVLAIDDVQFLANRESSQEELFHTFNALYQNRRQLILSADSPPAEIPTLEERLVSRFSWGLVAQIDPPNRETRQAILAKKARLRGLEVPAEVLDLVAERVAANVRVLEGTLTRLVGQARLDGQPLTLAAARRLLDEAGPQDARRLHIRDIQTAVAAHFGIRLAELVGRRRSRSIAHPRQVGMYLARQLTPLSLEEIGAHFGGRDHSTVLYAERVIESARSQDPETAQTLSLLTRRLLTTD